MDVDIYLVEYLINYESSELFGAYFSPGSAFDAIRNDGWTWDPDRRRWANHAHADGVQVHRLTVGRRYGYPTHPAPRVVLYEDIGGEAMRIQRGRVYEDTKGNRIQITAASVGGDLRHRCKGWIRVEVDDA